MSLFIGKSFPVIVLFIVSIVYSRRLSYHNNGIFQSIWMYSNILNTMLAFGITTLILSSNTGAISGVIKRNKSIIIVFYVLLAVLLFSIFFIYEKDYEFSLKSLVVIFVIIQTLGTIYESFGIKQQHEQKVLFINLIYSAGFLIWHLFSLTKQYSFSWLVTGIIILSVFRLACLYYFFKPEESKFSADDKLILRHWGFVGINDAVGIFSRWFDKIILIYLLTPASFAVFFNGSFEIPLFALMVSVAGNISNVEIALNLGNPSAIIKIYKTVFSFLSAIVFPLFLFCLFARHELYALLFDNKYNASVTVFLITSFILPLRINNYTSILQSYNKGSTILSGSLLDIAVMSVMILLLYPVWGINGVAVSVVAATYMQAGFYLLTTSKLLETSVLDLIPWRSVIVRFLLLSIIYFVLYYFIKELDQITQLIIGGTFTALLILCGLYLFYNSKNNFIYAIAKKNINR